MRVTAKPFTLEEIKSNYPKTYCYLIEHEKDFKSRESGRAATLPNWFAYIYPKNLTKFEQKKLSSMEICAKHPNLTLDTSSFYHPTTVYSWVKNSASVESYEYLLAIANSKVLWWFLKLTGDTLQGDARRFKTNYLNPFPMPKQPDPKLEALIESKVKEVLKIKQQANNNCTENLEEEIDQLVYQLYQLTDNEIKIIEKASE